MPLIQSGSKKAFKKNVETEMDANPGKDNRAQNLAIAYSVKRKNRKKMAEGGSIETEASSEKRPMPDNVYGDSNQVSRNRGDKALRDSDWTGQPTVRQSQSPSPHLLSQPKGVGSDSLAMRQRAMHDDEEDFEDSVPPQSDKAQPIQRDNEDGPNRQGPGVPDMERQHNNKRAAYAKGGNVEQMEADDEAHLMDSARPSSPSEQPKGSYDESHDYAPISANPDEAHPHTGESENDMLRRHAMERAMYADGGNVDLEQSHLEPEETSMAREIMKKRMMASGGEVDLEGNSEEDLNNEDQMSFKAGLKEQYDLRQLDKQPKDSNEDGDSREEDSENQNDEDDISAIRRKMKAKKAA